MFRPLALILLIAIAAAARAAEPSAEEFAATRQTFVYKTVGPTNIEADVYRLNGELTRPAVVWIHGGALIMGNRNGVPRQIAALCRSNNYVLVSLDYRLAPEVRLPEIIEDIEDAFRWIRTDGPARLHLDPQKIVVAGGSAGGYLTLMTGFCVAPRPKALVSYWGYGDIDGPWYTTPSDHYRKSPLVTKEEAYGVIGKGVTTGSDSGPRGKYYLYLRQNGLWAQEVSGFDPRSEPRKFDPYCPVRNVTPQYPPTLLIHGTADTDVPYQESADMAAALKKQGVEHELITIDGGDHGLSDRNNSAVIEAHARAIEFMRKHLE